MKFRKLKHIFKKFLLVVGVFSIKQFGAWASIVSLFSYVSYKIMIDEKKSILDIDQEIARDIDDFQYESDQWRIPASVDNKANVELKDKTETKVLNKDKDFFAEDTAENEKMDSDSKRRVVNLKGRAHYANNSGAIATTSNDAEDSGDATKSNLKDSLLNRFGNNNIESVTASVVYDSSPKSGDVKGGTTADDMDDSPTVVETKDISSFSCAYNKSEGTYVSSIKVELTCSEPAKIWYCLQQGDSFCDPDTVYSGAININAGNGTYQLSFYGEALSSGDITSLTNLTYIIDATIPSLSVNFPYINVQTTELPLLNYTQSSDFGKDGFYYHQINFKGHDPTSAGLDWTCSEMFYNHEVLSAPIPSIIESDYDLISIFVSKQIKQSVDLIRLETGNNYIVTIIEDRERDVFSCQVQNVILNDFNLSTFTGTSGTPVVNGVRSIAGGFDGYGHFQDVPNTTFSGSVESTKLGIVNKANFFDMLY